VSIASVWEIAIKVRRGLLRLREPCHVWLHAAIDTSGFQVLAVAVDHAVDFASLPDHHPDPFDRMLIVQARAEGLTIVTSDTAFDDYDVKVLDARA
jgi:PIN domain nuclease of toxin-antitoxin system